MKYTSQHNERDLDFGTIHLLIKRQSTYKPSGDLRINIQSDWIKDATQGAICWGQIWVCLDIFCLLFLCPEHRMFENHWSCFIRSYR